MLEEKTQPGILYPAKVLKNEGEMKTFWDKQKLRKCVTSGSASPEILKEVLQAESKWLQIVMQIHNNKEQ